MDEIWQIAILFLLSSIKFFIAPTAAVIAKYGFISSVVITFSGGSAGFIVFYNFWNFLKTTYQKIFKRKQKIKKKFSKKNKFIVKAKTSYGILGVALLTPCLLGIPLGAILASNFFPKNKNVFPVFLGSIFIWSVVLTYISLYIKLP